MNRENVFSLDAEDVLAREVLSVEMGNACDGPRTEQLAAAWEEANSKALVRPWEETEETKTDGRPVFAASYYARKKIFAKRERPGRKDLQIPPDVARSELGRLRRMPWKDQVDAINKGRNARRINDLESVLGLPVTDYTKDEPPQPSNARKLEVEARFNQLQQLSVAARMETVAKDTDLELVTHFMYWDPSAKVQDVAQTRLFELSFSALTKG